MAKPLQQIPPLWGCLPVSCGGRGKGVDLLRQQLPGLGGRGGSHEGMPQSRGTGEARAGPAHVFASDQQTMVAAILHQTVQLIAGQCKPC